MTILSYSLLVLVIMSDSFKYFGINDICAKKRKKRVDTKVKNASVLSTTLEIHITFDRSQENSMQRPVLSQSYIISPWLR